MERYIDANKLYEWTKEFYPNDTQFMSAILNAPTVDVVKVVRCEECKYLTMHNGPTLYAYCEKNHYRFEPFQTDTRTHFCSYGVRENENSN